MIMKKRQLKKAMITASIVGSLAPAVITNALSYFAESSEIRKIEEPYGKTAACSYAISRRKGFDTNESNPFFYGQRVVIDNYLRNCRGE
jgi:hypothetical protein